MRVSTPCPCDSPPENALWYSWTSFRAGQSTGDCPRSSLSNNDGAHPLRGIILRCALHVSESSRSLQKVCIPLAHGDHLFVIMPVLALFPSLSHFLIPPLGPPGTTTQRNCCIGIFISGRLLEEPNPRYHLSEGLTSDLTRGLTGGAGARL